MDFGESVEGTVASIAPVVDEDGDEGYMIGFAELGKEPFCLYPTEHVHVCVEPTLRNIPDPYS